MVSRRRMRRNLKKSFGITFIVLVLIVGFMISTIFVIKPQMEAKAKERDAKIIAACEALPVYDSEEFELINISGTVGDIDYSFMGPEFLDGKKEENEAGIYYFANNEEEDLKLAFYIYLNVNDMHVTFEDEALVHEKKTQFYYWQAINNNGNRAFFIDTHNNTAYDAITIEHTNYCGKHLEFSCALMCGAQVVTCEDIFDSLDLKCNDETWNGIKINQMSTMIEQQTQ